MPCPCCGCDDDADCQLWCEQIGEMVNAEDPCPSGFGGTSAACRKVTAVESCDECNETNFPAPSGLTDYGLNCIGYCCDNQCQPDPCCTADCLWEYVFPSGGNPGYWNLVADTCGEGCSCDDAEEPNYTPPTPEPGEEGVVEAYTQCVEVVEGLSLAGGPGTELKKLFALVGITPKKGCKCAKRARYMDRMGCDWCLENTDTIVRWLREEHERRKLLVPFSDLIARQVVKLAVKKARKANSK
jgi:hypothetical protein